MRTTTRIHTRAERLALREANLCRALRTRWRLLAVVSFLRGALTQVLPLAGSGGWWLCALSLLGAYVPYLLCARLLKKTNAATLQEALRAAWGGAGVWLVYLLAAFALLADGLCTLTALTTLFTQGIGARGTQFTLGVLTCAAVLFCLNRDGQAYGMQLLRWPLGAFLLVAALCAPMRADGLFPLGGQGKSAALQALAAGAGLGWPLVLLLMEEPVHQAKRWRDPLPAWGLGLAVLLMVTLTVPHEVLVQHASLAQSLLVPAMYLPSAAELAALCLWMAGLFLALAVAVRCAADALTAPAGRNVSWLAAVLTAAASASQWIPAHRLWQVLQTAQVWLCMPLHVGLWALSIGLMKRRKKEQG